MTIHWQTTQIVPASADQVPLRDLLEQHWLLPHRIVHFLRIRENVWLNGRYQPMSTPVQAGDQVVLRFVGDEFRTATSNYLVDDTQPVTVLFENDDLLVVNKPAGIKTHPNRQDERGTLMNFVAGYLARQNAVPFMVHRIDQQTSGAVLIAKTPIVVPLLDRLISSRQIHRHYLAITDGVFPEPAGVITLPIGRDETDRRKRQIDGVHAQTARTHYQVLGAYGTHSLVRLQLETGRTHQIRVHLAAMQAPIVGDPLYNERPNAKMMLHGTALTVVLPFTGQKITVNAPNPRYFEESIVKWHLK